MNLIEELGIEKCRAIVEGAPDWASHYVPDRDKTICCHNEDHFYFRDQVKLGVEHIRLNDLRTAIADYDNHWYGQSEEKELEQYAILSQEKIEGGAVFVGNFTVIQQQLQSELNNCSEKDSSEISITNHCTDIRNHISPLTEVIE